jgi:hypothetical protein
LGWLLLAAGKITEELRLAPKTWTSPAPRDHHHAANPIPPHSHLVTRNSPSSNLKSRAIDTTATTALDSDLFPGPHNVFYRGECKPASAMKRQPNRARERDVVYWRPQEECSSDASPFQVLRWGALAFGVFYGFSHQTAISSRDKIAAAKHEYERKENLINQAKAAWAQKNAPKGQGNGGKSRALLLNQDGDQALGIAH